MKQCALDAARDVFPDSYDAARSRFLALAPHARSFASTASGPDGQTLFTDAAWFGPVDAGNILVTVSAMHGVEGYCGSACQIDWMTQFTDTALPPNTAALIVHAINPYGYAWDRRVTEEGCDQNRNFVDFDLAVPANPGYDELAQYLVPSSLDGPAFSHAETVIAEYRRAHGELAFQVARKSGQYRHPGGMFFGGFGPTSARLTLERIAAEYRIAERRHVIIVDFHTGLGSFGYGELQCEQASGLDGYQRAVTAFGHSVTSPDLGTSSSVVLHGTADEFWERLLGDRHIYVCLEFGTFDSERGRRVLRQDQWLATYHPNEIDSALGRKIRAETRQHYFPESEDWKEMVVFRSRQVARQALAQMASVW